MPYPLIQTIPCPNCSTGTLERFAQDTQYHYYKCQNALCGKERLIPKNPVYAEPMIKRLMEARGK